MRAFLKKGVEDAIVENIYGLEKHLDLGSVPISFLWKQLSCQTGDTCFCCCWNIQ